MRLWELPDARRSLLSVVGPFLEIRVVRDDVILGRARFTDVERALTVAQLWRIERKIGWGPSLLDGSDVTNDEVLTDSSRSCG